MHGGFKCSLKAMMPESRADLLKDPPSYPQHLEITSHTYRDLKADLHMFWGLGCLWHRELPLNAIAIDLLYVFTPTNTYPLPPSCPSQLLRVVNNVMLLLPGNAFSLEGEKCFIVFLLVTAALSRSLPLKERRTPFLFCSCCVFAWICVCMWDTVLNETNNRWPLGTGRDADYQVTPLQRTMAPQLTLVSWCFGILLKREMEK